MVYDKVHQVLAQGNYALTISEGTLGNAKTAYYDLWRIENGKIKEHWDVMETIADKKTGKIKTENFKMNYLEFLEKRFILSSPQQRIKTACPKRASSTSWTVTKTAFIS